MNFLVICGLRELQQKDLKNELQHYSIDRVRNEQDVTKNNHKIYYVLKMFLDK